ncbi:MAG: META domain-containing protein [Variovorax sp.]
MRSALRPLSRFILAALFAAGITACGSGISLDEPIEGPVWWLTQLNGQPIEAGREPQRDPQVAFDRNSGRVSGSGGCNRLSGAFTRAGSALRIGQLVSTKMACVDPARSGIEAQFLQALQTATAYRLAGPDRLVLLDEGGRTAALLSSQPSR